MAPGKGSEDLDVSQRWTRREDLALLTDFYQLTMMAGYWKSGRKDLTACFNYFFRDLPPHNGFAVAAGLEQLLDLVEGLRFNDQDIRYLSGLKVFDPAFLEYLRGFQVRCTVEAVPEGTVVFAHEPVMQVVGPLIQAQLLETAILNTLNYQSLIATKAARIRQACGGDNLVEFGLRRAQGPDGGLSGARAAYIGGADSTSNVLAGKVFGIPVRGTVAHSWIMSFDDELSAFRAYAACFSDPILLVDTYDTLTSGLPNAVTVFKELRAAGRPVRAAIRLDSGDLARLSKAARRMFAEAGFQDPLIVASNELTEDLIADLKRQGAPINSWGVGTHLITSSDHPALGGVYKLVAVKSNEGAWKPRIKLSSNPLKMTDPGRKRLVRYSDENGLYLADIIRLYHEPADSDLPAMAAESAKPATPAVVLFADRHDGSYLRGIAGATRSEHLLEVVMEDGKRVGARPSLEEMKARAQHQLACLPEETRRLRNPDVYTVGLSPSLAEEKFKLAGQIPGALAPGPIAQPRETRHE
ncbi:MAG: nicotinate phosphoribosyltransferase [Actinobacteria bacterium]|nr:nicotinate phosphoribosyltransferase [Actinomycetota bacterium]